MLAVPIWLAAQTTVNGVVSEEGTGFSLSDVSVTNESTLEETFADMDGNFTIQANEGDRLVFSLAGYDDVVVNYNNESTVNVTMRAGSTYQLDDVVVIGYGTTTHKDATGAVTSVTEKDFNQGLSTAPEQLLTGKVAGLQINTAGGAPGTGSRMRIRGGSSLSANNDPLFVVDGIPMDNGASIAGSSNPLNYINPSDIESISVLKDASSTAIYGARASNGVIIITTKRGKKGKKLGINFNSTVSLSERMNQVDVLSADEFRNAVMQRGSESVQALLGNANTNWQDEIFKTALGYDNNLGITGMITDNIPFRVSLGYTNQDGILKTGNFERTTASVSLTPSLFDDHLKIDINARGSYEENRFADVGAIGNAIRMDPTQSVYSGNNRFGGYWEWLGTNGNPNVNSNRNPLAMLMMKQDLAYVRRSVGNIKFDYKVHGFEDLTATLNLGYDYSDSNGKNLVSDSAALSYAAAGVNKDYNQIRRNQLLDFYLNYNKEIPSIKSRIDATAGYSYQSFDYDNFEVNQNFRQTLQDPPTTADINTRVLIGFFGRLNYTFNEKYLLTATIRRDGSSRFAKDVRWGWFPSVAAAWNISDENFLKNSETVSNMKLRLGWGITGQENIPGNVYPYLPVYLSSTNQYAYYPMGDNYVPILRPNIYNPLLKWEEQTTWNIGLDFGFFNNRMWGSVDFYKKITNDMLSTIAAPLPNLNNLIIANVGDMENQGVEIALGGDVIRTTDLTWTLNANATYNENKITKLSGGGNDFYTVGGISGGLGNNLQVNMVGVAAGSFYVYEQVYDSEGNPIQGAYVDQNGDGTINEQDLRPFHNGQPDWTLGLSSNLTYKNWDLGFSMRANLGNYMYNNVASDIGTYAGLLGSNGFISNVQSDALNTGFTTAEFFSDYYVQNASFLRMDYLTLGYTFHKAFGKTDIRFSGTVQNVFVVTDYDGLDPEVVQVDADPNKSNIGIDNNFYPRPRIFSLGVNVNF